MQIKLVDMHQPSASNVDLLEEMDEVEDLEMKTGQGGCGKVYSQEVQNVNRQEHEV